MSKNLILKIPRTFPKKNIQCLYVFFKPTPNPSLWGRGDIIMWITHYNTSELREVRKKLRNNPTKYEEILWEYLKWRKFLWLKFRRQHSIGRYVLDFYCPSIRVWIEIDGEIHNNPENKIYDAICTEYITSDGIHIIRFTNFDIDYNREQVLKDLESYILQIKS